MNHPCRAVVLLAMLCRLATAAGNEPSPVSVHLNSNIIPAHKPPTFAITNSSPEEQKIELRYNLQLNSTFIDTVPPDPVLGYDHATGVKASVTIDGKEYGDPLLTDGNDYTSFESPWTAGHKEAIVTIDLGESRTIRGMAWLAGDANWIWKVDVEVSEDGKDYAPVPSLQNFDMHKKWARQTFPLASPFTARHLRFRFTNPAGTMNIIRLPRSIEVFDGIENDQVNVPTTGQRLAEGTLTATIPAGEQSETQLHVDKPLPPGSYLVSWTIERSPPAWQSLLVKPAGSVDKARTRRFGINSSDPKLAPLMSQCGFGWVRFENAKWQMFCNAPDHYAFDGSIAPWHVNHDAIFEIYHAHNMQVLPYVFQPPEWATSAGSEITVNRAGYPPKNPADYGEAIFQLVARHGASKHDAGKLKTTDKRSGLARINAVELWNEPNLVGPSWAAFVGPTDKYFEVMRAGVEGARRADPDMVVTSCGWAGVELATVKQMTDYRYADGTCPLDLVDVVNVHFYSGREEPEVSHEDPNIRKEKTSAEAATYLDQLDELIAWRDQHKPSAEIWLTETGNDVGGPIGLSERKQAAKLPRVTMITLARGIDKVFIYRESGSKESMHAGAGLLRDDGTLRPSWFTIATMIRQLEGCEGKAERLPHNDPNVWLLKWNCGDREVVTAWTIGEPMEIGVKWLGEGRAPKTLVDAFGHTMNVGRTDKVTLTEFPVYVAY